eukprot:TRINITY_DN21579_c0_g1_i1.p1 TRINITY_DN21579_c0_g1~~TRINITY_DN21579_c0_g1_i1.p1  ORF type:complete len:326 (+),score=111.53 TRINITY_DN21579_c0_g1_i1:76-978(+)
MSDASGSPGRLLSRAQDVWKARSEKVRNRFTSSRRFKKACRDAWKQCDLDNSGTVDVAEVYVGVLLLYLKLSRFVPGCVPPDKARIAELVRQMDVDGSGTLDEDEFMHLATVLCEHIAGRVAVEGFTLYVLGPLMAMVVTAALGYSFDMDAICSYFGEGYRSVLDSVIDLTIVCVVFAVVVPFISDQLDQYAKKAAQKESHKLELESSGVADFGDGVDRLAVVTDPGKTRLRSQLPDPRDSGNDLYFGQVVKDQLVGVISGPHQVSDREYLRIRTRPSAAAPTGVEGYIRAQYVDIVKAK